MGIERRVDFGEVIVPALRRDGYSNDQIGRFELYHIQHPDIWRKFEATAFRMIEAGMKHYGAMAIFNYLRFHEAIEKRGDFIVNNNYQPMYARMFEAKWPEHSGFFEMRVVNQRKAA